MRLANYKATDGRPTRLELTQNIYDPTTGLLSKVEHKTDSKPWKELAAYTYDDFNRVKRETLGDLLETRDYDYNLRGQLTGINKVFAETGDPEGRRRSFGESIKYDYGFSMPRYDGKVAGWYGGAAEICKPMATNMTPWAG